jgi:hypothetical protein
MDSSADHWEMIVPGSAQLRPRPEKVSLAFFETDDGELSVIVARFDFDEGRWWRAIYWRPIEINREFARHFAPRSRWRQALIAMTGRLHRRLSRPQIESADFVSHNPA